MSRSERPSERFIYFGFLQIHILIHYSIRMTHLFSRPEHSSYVLLFMGLLFPKYIFDASRSYNRNIYYRVLSQTHFRSEFISYRE